MKSIKKLWMQCKLLIPGGNGLISKRPERYSEDKWPTFYKKSKGLNVWDLNGKKYKDMSQMGIGTCVLGYANHYIDRRVKKACLGKKVVTAGSSPYSKIAIAYEAKNKTSYFKYIDDIIKFQNFKKSKKIEINAKKLLYIFENSLNVQTINMKDLSKDKKYKTFLNSIHTKNFKKNSIFLLFNKILQNGITNSEIYKKLIKII